MNLPEQHSPTVYACAAGAVLHGHADGTLEPAVVLHTFVPAAVGERLDGPGVRVDVSSDGPAAATVTVRVLAEDQSLTWSLPIAPLVAALPGQSGDDGRMVLLALVDGEPEPGFWAQPVDCEQLAAELQLPVADLAEALRGRLTPWLAEDLELLLHDDAHDRAVETSPAQAVADAVLAHYRGDLGAADPTSRLVSSLVFAPEAMQVELGARLCAALATAVRVAGPTAIAEVLAQTGPFEGEEQRLLAELPPALESGAAPDTDAAMDLVLAAPDRDEGVRAAVRVTARLARAAFGPDLADEQVLQRLHMVDDAGLLRLAVLWVSLALLAAARDDPRAVLQLAEGVDAEGPPGEGWLLATAAALGHLAREALGRRVERVGPALQRAEDPATSTADRVLACLELARTVRARSGAGPGSWLLLPPPAAAEAVVAALVEGADRESCLDLLGELLAPGVEAPELLDGLVCATAQLLTELDPQSDETARRMQVAELLGMPAAERWLLPTLLRLAPQHDPFALDLSALLPPGADDPDRAADKLGRTGLLRVGVDVLSLLANLVAAEAEVSGKELLADVLPSALAEHDLLRDGT